MIAHIYHKSPHLFHPFFSVTSGSMGKDFFHIIIIIIIIINVISPHCTIITWYKTVKLIAMVGVRKKVHTVLHCVLGVQQCAFDRMKRFYLHVAHSNVGKKRLLQ